MIICSRTQVTGAVFNCVVPTLPWSVLSHHQPPRTILHNSREPMAKTKNAKEIEEDEVMEDDQQQDEQEEEEEEYEIEAILNAKPGLFEGVRGLTRSNSRVDLTVTRHRSTRSVTSSSGRATASPTTAGSTKRMPSQCLCCLSGVSA